MVHLTLHSLEDSYVIKYLPPTSTIIINSYTHSKIWLSECTYLQLDVIVFNLS